MSWSSAWIGCGVSPGQIAIDDSDDTRQPRVEHALDDRQHVRVHGDALVQLAVHEQVVDAHGAGALEGVARGTDVELALEALEIGGHGVAPAADSTPSRTV